MTKITLHIIKAIWDGSKAIWDGSKSLMFIKGLENIWDKYLFKEIFP